MKKELGKIIKAEFGFGGYQESMFGLTVVLKFGGCCEVVDFISGFWNESIIISEYTKWTEEDRSISRIDLCKKVDKILSDAKVNYISQLIGKPVELTIDGLSLKDWRILTEVI